MRHAAKSMMACSTYLVIIDTICLFIPEMAFFFLGIKSSPDLMVMMLGMVFLIVSSLYIRSAEKDKGEEFFFLNHGAGALRHSIFSDTGTGFLLYSDFFTHR